MKAEVSAHCGEAEIDWEATRKIIRWVCVRLCPREAEDLEQDVMVRLVAGAAKKFDQQRGQWFTFVQSVAKYACIDRMRMMQRRPKFMQIEENWIAAESGRERTAKEEAALRAVERLREHDRTLIQMIYSGTSFRMAAESLNMPLGTVKSHVSRILHRLRKAASRCAA